MGSYRNENLKQCVRNLFAQAQYEFRVIHNIEYKFKTDLSDMLKCKVSGRMRVIASTQQHWN